MATVYVKDNESVDSAFRRWKRKCSNDGIIGDLKRHEVYEKPSVRRKKKAENAKKRKY
jgi:small subunit ribosomal protein S21